jgi:hypothetical protein
MEVCGQLHAPATLLEEQTPVPIEQETVGPRPCLDILKTSKLSCPYQKKNWIIQRTQTSVSSKHTNKQLVDLNEYEVIMSVGINLQTFVLYLHVVWLTVPSSTALQPTTPQPS